MPKKPSKRSVTENDFCALADLSNEASVEQFFVSRLIEALGFKDRQISPKISLKVHSVSLGRKKVNYKPDYALKVQSKVRVVIDAKSVEEDLEDWIGQCAGYCLTLNRGYRNDNPVQYFVLSNGIHTQLYEWDSDTPFSTFTSQTLSTGTRNTIPSRAF